jgi:hypothetical protein
VKSTQVEVIVLSEMPKKLKAAPPSAAEPPKSAGAKRKPEAPKSKRKAEPEPEPAQAAAADADEYEDELEEEYEDEEEEEEDEEEETLVRGKWIYNEAGSIDGMIAALRRQIEYLEHLKKDGWYMADNGDDYVSLRRDRR